MSQLLPIEPLESRLFLEAAKLLFIRGADRSGGFLEATNDAGRTEQLADINNSSTSSGNHGWFQLKQALEQDGFIVEQITESIESGAPSTGQVNGRHIDLESLNLNQYSAIVFASNNAIYDSAAIDAIENYVRGGGAALFISDANFGSNWADAPNSDQQFLSRFGITVNQDLGQYALERSAGDFVAANHPILAGVNSFDGEGVSPLFISSTGLAGVSAQLVARARQDTRINAPPYVNQSTQQGQTRPTNSGDASLLVATADAGRIAGHFDRNTFFNTGGAGTNITRLDNRTYALNLFNWLAFGNPNPAAPSSIGGKFSFERLPLRVSAKFNENVSASISSGDLLLTNLNTSAQFTPNSASYDAGNTAAFRFNAPLPDGNYRATIARNNVSDTDGNPLQHDFTLDFFVLTGDTNRDRRIDLKDFSTLAANFNRPGTFSQGDFDYDLVVTIADFALLASKFNQTLPPL